MKVWLVNHYAYPPTQAGGTRHYDIGTRLAQKGHQVTIWSTSRSHASGQEMKRHRGLSPVVEEFDGITWVWLKTSPYKSNGISRGLNMLSFAFSFWLAALRQPRPDVLVGSSVHPFAPVATLVLGKLWGVKAVTEIRDLWPSSLVDAGMPANSPIVTMFSLIEKLLYRQSDALISVLPNAFSRYTSLGAKLENIFVVPNGTGLALEERAARTGAKRFAYLGSLGYNNKLSTLVEAAEILARKDSEISLSIIGDGPERAELVALIDAKGLSNIKVEPPIPKQELGRVFDCFDGFVVHSLKLPVHQFGISFNKLFDYMAGGRPVVFAAVAANNAVEEAGCGLSIEPEDPEAMAAAILELSSKSPQELLAMGKRGQDYIREHHTVQALADKFESALYQVLALNSSTNCPKIQ